MFNDRSRLYKIIYNNRLLQYVQYVHVYGLKNKLPILSMLLQQYI